MIDIHSHILPSIDDGAKSQEDSIAMAKAALEEGITTIVATPHHRNGQFDNEGESILKWVELLTALFDDEGIPLEVLPGQETRIHGDMIEELETDIILPINHSKYVFVELPTAHVPRYTSQMLFDIQVAGYIPIIVHPERNQELLENPTRLYEFVKKGALTQVTAGSLVGNFGKNIQKFSHQLVEANLTHFLASDAHNTSSRGFFMRQAFQEIKKQYGSDYSYMLQENSELLITNQNINQIEPQHIKRKKFLGLF